MPAELDLLFLGLRRVAVLSVSRCRVLYEHGDASVLRARVQVQHHNGGLRTNLPELAALDLDVGLTHLQLEQFIAAAGPSLGRASSKCA